MAKGLFDLENHFAFYGAYHSNPINILIHTIFVWPILYTALVLFQFTPTLFSFALADDKVVALNFSFVFALIYAVFYVLMDRKAGSLAAILCFLCWIGSESLATRLGFSLGWKVVLAAQVFCWTGQFLGHGLFEKRAPALLDNLVQAFLMGPLFVLMEVLQMLIGYEPYPGFHARVSKKIEANRKEWQDKRQKKIT
ncbi:endoplasmic reticulum membrane protein C16E8.02 [Carex littledalei]|uniref:Endoplasmic reticulum membrane protein C16E8.02 n=1 Tax=Carex littledalei TaxID=544730 RepID=A0A833QYZ6_9POAL|nr:endoplasmic reticulum membrane protein C16E8.02 [Carex littledalei]